MPRLRPARILPRRHSFLRPQKTAPSRTVALAKPHVPLSEDDSRCFVKHKSLDFPSQPQYTPTPEDEIIISRIKEGKSYASISRELNRPYSSLRCHFLRYLAPFSPELSAKASYDPKIDEIVRTGLRLGKTIRQMSRETGHAPGFIGKHYWRYSTPDMKGPAITKENRERIMELKLAGQTNFQVSAAVGLSVHMVHKIYSEDWPKQEIPRSISDLFNAGSSALDTATKLDVPLPLVRNFFRRLKGNKRLDRLSRPRTTAHWTKTKRERLVALWEKGHNLSDIALKLGFDDRQVRNALWKWRSELTREYRPTSRPRFSTEDLNKIKEWRSQKLSYAEIASRLPDRKVRSVTDAVYKYRL